MVAKYFIGLHVAEAWWSVERTLCWQLVHTLLYSEQFAIVPMLYFDKFLVEFFGL